MSQNAKTNMTIEAPKQGRGKLADFLSLLAAWEIPILSIKSDAGGMFTEPDHEPSDREWARYKLVCFPNVKSIYVLSVNEEQRKDVEFFCQGNNWKVLA